MSTEQPRSPPDRSVLGDSWVVASATSIKERNTEDDGIHQPASPAPDSRRQDSTKINNASPASSAWSIAGPELVMPSICEVSLSEASWVAPEVRATNQPPSQAMHKRRKTSSSEKDSLRDQRPSDSVAGNTDAGTSTTLKSNPERKGISIIARLATSYSSPSPLFRTLMNAILIATMLHLLILPELVYQAQDLCRIPTVANRYPSSCIPIPPKLPLNTPIHKPTSPKESIVAAQKRLESVLDSTLNTLTPLSDVLKQSEKRLRELQSQMKTAFPDVHNALTLEFKGSDQAVQAATWEFDSLRADLRSAVESLLSSPPALDVTGGSIARDTRLATQLRRREQYLDRLRAQIGRKAESLCARLTTLDDHLEAVAGIVAREQRRMGAADSSANSLASHGNRTLLLSLLDSLQHLGAFFLSPRSSFSDGASGPDAPAAISDLLRQTARLHRPVADSVRRLSRQLRDA